MLLVSETFNNALPIQKDGTDVETVWKWTRWRCSERDKIFSRRLLARQLTPLGCERKGGIQG